MGQHEKCGGQPHCLLSSSASPLAATHSFAAHLEVLGRPLAPNDALFQAAWLARDATETDTAQSDNDDADDEKAAAGGNGDRWGDKENGRRLPAKPLIVGSVAATCSSLGLFAGSSGASHVLEQATDMLLGEQGAMVNSGFLQACMGLSTASLERLWPQYYRLVSLRSCRRCV